MNKETKIWLSVIGGSIILIGLVAFVIRSKKYNCTNSFLFLGNSQTANKNSYVEMIKAKCPNARIKKIAKVGAKSEWILDEYKNEIRNGGNYDVVTVLVGGNDIFARKSIDKTKKNIQELINLVNSQGSKLVFISSPSKLYYSKTTPKHLQLADELETWIRKNKGVKIFVDITPATDQREFFAKDYLHLNNKGQKVIFDMYDKKVLK